MSIFEPRSDVVTIYTGDYLARIRHLEALAEADHEATDPVPLVNGERPRYLELAEEHDQLVREAEASAINVRVQALPRKVWGALVAKHPRRTEATEGAEPNQIRFDAIAGVNEDTFMIDLVYGGTVEIDGDEVPYRSLVEPAQICSDDIDALADVDFRRLYLTAFGLNAAVGADPKASLVSRLTQPSSETSDAPSS